MITYQLSWLWVPDRAQSDRLDCLAWIARMCLARRPRSSADRRIIKNSPTNLPNNLKTGFKSHYERYKLICVKSPFKRTQEKPQKFNYISMVTPTRWEDASCCSHVTHFLYFNSSQKLADGKVLSLKPLTPWMPATPVWIHRRPSFASTGPFCVFGSGLPPALLHPLCRRMEERGEDPRRLTCNQHPQFPTFWRNPKAPFSSLKTGHYRIAFSILSLSLRKNGL